MYMYLERFIIGATPAWRVILAIFASTPFFMIQMLAQGAALSSDEIRSALNTQVLLALQGVFLFGTVLNVGVLVHLWPRRHLPDQVPWGTLLVIQAIGITFSLMSVLAGGFTTGLNLVLLGILAVGLWLFERKPMVVGYATVIAVIAGYDLGVWLDWWPYAPVLSSRVYEGDAPVWWFDHWRQYVFVTGYAVLLSLLWLLLGSLETILAQLSRLSNTDALTGLANRRCFMEALSAEVERQARTEQTLCVILIDADHFKRVNDEHGHPEGDQVLRAVGRLLSECVRTPTDLACRLGGEEFALILPDTHREQAMAVCQRFRDRLAQHAFGAEGRRFHITLSMGLVASFSLDAAELLRQADEQLYRAKSLGRNRICTAGDEGSAA